MKKVRGVAIFVCSLMLFSSWPLAQEQSGPDRPSVDIPNRGEVGNRDFGIRNAGGPTYRSEGVVLDPGTRGSYTTAPRVGADTPRVNSRGGGSGQIPVQTYTPSLRVNIYDFYAVDTFLYRLMRRYDFFYGYEYLWRYAQGDSPLTPKLMQLALEDASHHSETLVKLAAELEQLLTDFEAGKIDPKTLGREFDDRLDQMRKVAKKIRGDDNLEYLDQRPDMKLESPAQASSLAELRVLMASLQEMALQMKQGIMSFYTNDLSRVVSVEDLNQPSFKSISKGIDKLSKTIEKSVDRL